MSSIVFEGYLCKRSRERNVFRKRWMILKDHALYSYIKKERKCTETINLKSCVKTRIISNKDKKFALIFSGKLKQRQFTATSKQIMHEWIDHINQVINGHDNKKHSKSNNNATPQTQQPSVQKYTNNNLNINTNKRFETNNQQLIKHKDDSQKKKTKPQPTMRQYAKKNAYLKKNKFITMFIIIIMIILMCIGTGFTIYSHQVQNCDDICNLRNIIFVGRSRTGKTTSIEVLKNKDYNPGLMNIIRGTRNTTFHSFIIQSKDNKADFMDINIIDTPGLFERTSDIKDKRTNEIILEMITKCIDMKLNRIHHVYFVMPIQYGLNKEDLIALDVFSNLFVGMEGKMSIILSFAQHLSTKQEYDHYINQFKSVPELTAIYSKVNGSIFFLGAIQKGAMYDTEQLKKNVYHQRGKLLKHIIEQNTSYNIKQLNVYHDSKENKMDENCIPIKCGEISSGSYQIVEEKDL